MATEVANIILAQLGGNKFRTMTGAKNLLAGDNYLSMQVPHAKGVNVVRITLNDSDTYTMETSYVRGTTYRVVDTRSDVYCDNLQTVFTSMTGLYTHL